MASHNASLHMRLTPREFCLANHVRAAAWAREGRSSRRGDRGRWAAKVAREWWRHYLAS